MSGAVRERIHAYTGGVANNIEVNPICVGGTSDHIHLLVSPRTTHDAKDIVQKIKSNSSRWIHQTLKMPRFKWQVGYGVFSVSHSQVKRVARYIEGQAQHHSKKTFKEEYLEFLERHEIEYDERYVWD